MDLLPYLKLALLSFFEGGEVALFLAAYEVYVDQMPLWGAALVLVCAVVAGDYMWYRFGRQLYGLPVLRHAHTRLSFLDAHIQAHPCTTALLARMSYGLHHMTVARYRDLGVPPRRMVCILGITCLVWLATLGGALVLFAQYLPEAKRYVRSVELLFALALLGYLVAQGTARFFLRTRKPTP